MTRPNAQPYLVNPPLALNPFEVLTIPHRKEVAHTDSRGRFVKVASLTKKRHHKAKKISRKAASRLFKKAAKLGLVHHFKKHTHKAVTASHKGKKSSKPRRSHLDIVRSGHKGFAGLDSWQLENPLMMINKHRSHKSMKKHTRRNPLMSMVSGSEVKSAGKVILQAALLLGGMKVATKISDAVTEKFPTMGQPLPNLLLHLGLGSLIYVAGSRVKKIPQSVVNALAIGMILPAASQAYDMVASKIGGTPAVAAVSYGKAGAYVPANRQLSAYVPQRGMGGTGYGDKY